LQETEEVQSSREQVFWGGITPNNTYYEEVGFGK